MKYFIIAILLAFPSYAEVCKQETKASFEKHLFATKFTMDASCAVFYKDTKHHIACWSDQKKSAVLTVTSVRCK